MSESSNSGNGKGPAAPQHVIEEALSGLEDPSKSQRDILFFLSRQTRYITDISLLKKILAAAQKPWAVHEDGRVDQNLADELYLLKGNCGWRIATLSSNQELADALANKPATYEEASAYVEQIQKRLKTKSFSPAKLQTIITGLENLRFVGLDGTILSTDNTKALIAECRAALEVASPNTEGTMSHSSNSATGGPATGRTAETEKRLDEAAMNRHERDITIRLSIAAKLWGEGKVINEFEEEALTSLAPEFYDNSVLLSIAQMQTAKLGGGNLAEAQKKKIIYSAKEAIDAIYEKVQPTILDPTSPDYKAELKKDLANMRGWKKFISSMKPLFPYFPSLQKAERVIEITLDPPSDPNALLRNFVIPAITDGKEYSVLLATRPTGAVVSGKIARARINALLSTAESANSTSREWAISYLMDCIASLPEKEKPEAVLNVLLESSKFDSLKEELFLEAERLTQSLPEKQRKALLASAQKSGESSLQEFAREVDTLVTPFPVPPKKDSGATVEVETTAILSPQTVARKFAEGIPVSLRELLPSTYKGQPAHVILNAATILLDVDVKNPADETARNLMAAGVLENLSIDSARGAVAKRTPANISQRRFPRFLNHLSRNTSELRSFVSDLNTMQAVAGLAPTKDGEGVATMVDVPTGTGSSAKKKDLLSQVRSAWEIDDVIGDFEELTLCDKVSNPANIAILTAINGIAVSELVISQKERIIAAGKPAVEAICGEAIRDAHIYANETSKIKRKELKSRVKLAQKTLFHMNELVSHFPEIGTAYEAVTVSIDQPAFSNGKIALASSIIEGGRNTVVLDSISPQSGVVTGFFARDRIGQLLTSNKMNAETAKWAVYYLGDCIRRAPSEERAKAVVLLLKEASEIPLARQHAINEAASIAYRALHADQKYISRKIHSVSKKAGFGSPDKTLFIEFAKEIRRYSADPKLFPITVEERQKAGGAFKKDTTVIMTTFHTSVESEERAARGEHPLTEILDELDGPGAEKPAAHEETAEPPKPVVVLPAPVEPEPVVRPEPTPAPEAEPEYAQDLTVRELLDTMDRNPEPMQLPGNKVRHAISGISILSPKERRRAFRRAFGYLSEGKEGYSELDFIRELSIYVRPEAKQFAVEAAEAMLSLSEVAKIGPVEAQEIRSRLASANPEIVDAAILNKLNFGTKNEAGEALLVLVERAEIRGTQIESGASLYEIALTELIGMGSESAIPALFSLSETDCPSPLLLEFLTAYELHEAGNLAIDILLRKTADEPEAALFSAEAKERHPVSVTEEKAEIAVRLLNIYGGAGINEKPIESAVAKGVSRIGSAQAIEFLMQGMEDAADAVERAAWQDGLRTISAINPVLAEETERKIISKFDMLSQPAMLASLELLAERPSVAQAKFLLSLASDQGYLFSKRAEDMLAAYDFSSLPNADKFKIMRSMYADGMPAEKGAALLKEFIPVNSADAKEWMSARFLSELFNKGADRELAKIAREALVSNSEGILASKYGVSGIDSILASLGSTNVNARELAKYALASQMVAQGENFSPTFHKSLYYASAKFKKEGNDEAILGIISAAHAAYTQEAMRQVLVPYLAAEKTFSEFSAKALLSSTEGAQQLALAAGMENHPVGLSKEGSLKISQNAFNALSQEDTEFSSRALVSLLGNKTDDLHISALKALEKAGDSKCPALLEVLPLGDSWEKYAAIKLLPAREEFVSKVLPLSIDADTSVSSSAMDYVLSTSGAKGLASILSNLDIPEEIQQELSNYCAKNKPAISKKLFELAQTEGKEAEEAIRALEFFPTNLSFPVLLTVMDSEKSTVAAARQTLVQMCWLISADTGGADAENAAHDLFEVYLHATDREVRNAIIYAAKGPFAEFMLEDAIQELSHSYSALEIFIATENIAYAAEVAQSIIAKAPFPEEDAESLPPLWQALFSHDLGKMAEIKPGSTEYKVLQEVAELEFIHGQGSREARELISAFMEKFGSMQVRDSLFERGPLGVSEFLWSMRGDENEEKAAYWLRSMKDADTNLLLDVLISHNYSALDRLLENPELAEAVSSHAMRRALLSFAELSKQDGSANEGRAKEGIELYSQLLSRDATIGMPFDRHEEAQTLQKNLGLRGMINEEGIAKGEKMIRSVYDEILETASLRASARAEARKLSRERAPPPADRPLRRVRRVTGNPK